MYLEEAVPGLGDAAVEVAALINTGEGIQQRLPADQHKGPLARLGCAQAPDWLKSSKQGMPNTSISAAAVAFKLVSKQGTVDDWTQLHMHTVQLNRCSLLPSQHACMHVRCNVLHSSKQHTWVPHSG